MQKRLIYSLLILISGFAACKKDDYNPGQTSAVKVSNNWWCTFKLGGEDVYGLGTFLLTTYNTADNKDSIWIDDLGNSWQFKCKAAVDLTNLTFQTNESQNQYYDITAKIANGKVLPLAGHSKSGVVTDSLYLEATFSDDPDNTYIISGTARTGLIEDDY